MALLESPDVPAAALARLELFLNELLQMTALHIPLLAGMQEASAGERRHDFYQTPFYGWLHGLASSLLEEAVVQTEAVDIDVELTADAIFAVVAPPLLMFQHHRRGFTYDRIAAGVRRLFIDGLCASLAER